MQTSLTNPELQQSSLYPHQPSPTFGLSPAASPRNLPNSVANRTSCAYNSNENSSPNHLPRTSLRSSSAAAPTARSSHPSASPMPVGKAPRAESSAARFIYILANINYREFARASMRARNIALEIHGINFAGGPGRGAA